MNRPLLLGHRGLRVPGGPAENTFPAFDAALRAGCNGFEFDVRVSADNVPVIVHDREHLGHQVALTAAGDLRLALLEQVLSRYSGQAFLDIELKVPGIEEQVIRAVAQCSFGRGFVISSFLPDILNELHARDAALPLGFICDQPDRLALWRGLPVSYVIPQFELVQRRLVDEIHAGGRKLFTWTVNTRANMLRLAEWGVDGIISDDPQLLVATLRN